MLDPQTTLKKRGLILFFGGPTTILLGFEGSGTCSFTFESQSSPGQVKVSKGKTQPELVAAAIFVPCFDQSKGPDLIFFVGQQPYWGSGICSFPFGVSKHCQGTSPCWWRRRKELGSTFASTPRRGESGRMEPHQVPCQVPCVVRGGAGKRRGGWGYTQLELCPESRSPIQGAQCLLLFFQPTSGTLSISVMVFSCCCRPPRSQSQLQVGNFLLYTYLESPCPFKLGYSMTNSLLRALTRP